MISKSWKQLQLQDEIHFVFCNTLNQTFSVGECNYVQLLFNSSGLLSSSKVKRIVHSLVIFQMEGGVAGLNSGEAFLLSGSETPVSR